MKLIT